MSLEHRQYITIHEGTMLNTGPHEDSDCFVVTSDTRLVVVGSQKEGAVPVRIFEDGVVYPETLYFHQPEISNIFRTSLLQTEQDNTIRTK